MGIKLTVPMSTLFLHHSVLVAVSEFAAEEQVARELTDVFPQLIDNIQVITDRRPRHKQAKTEFTVRISIR